MAPSNTPYLDHPGPIPLVHRAASEGQVENTLPAIEAALSLGFRYVETDVRTTADGVAVLCHDPDLLRLADRSESIATLTFRALAAIPIGQARVPRLDEALDTWPELRLNIDLKDDPAIEAVATTLSRAGADSRVCVTSFVDRRIARFRRLKGPAVATGLGVRAAAALKAASRLPYGLRRCLPPRAVVAQLPMRLGGIPVLDRRLVTHAHRIGLDVHAWTINSRPVMEHLLDSGVDGIVTDAPLTLKAVLTERGQWVG